MRRDPLLRLRRLGQPNEVKSNPYESYSVRHRIIEFPAYCETIRKIAQTHSRGRMAQVPSGLLITGQSGAGKTTVLEQYADNFSRREDEERTIIPVLLVVTPGTPTVKSLAEAMLHALGDPFLNKGSAEEKTRRIYRYLVECQVELLIIDEFHHFYDSRRRHDARQITDWLKNLLNVARIPVMIVGLPRSLFVIRMNEQLTRRFSSMFYLSPFRFSTDEQQREFRAVLKKIHSELPLNAPPFHDANLARRFFFASNGLIDYVAKIVDAAVLIAGETGHAELTTGILAQAFEEAVWYAVPETLNPFNSTSALRPLTKYGEPFALWEDPAQIAQCKDPVATMERGK